MIQYSFYERDTCEMCGTSTEKNKEKGIRLNTTQGRNPKKKHGIAVSIQKCRQCGLIYSNPLPIPNNIGDHYKMPPESYWREGYFQADDTYFFNEISTFKKFVNFKSGMKALDVGAGIGKAMLSLQSAGFDAYGFEPAEPFYKRAIEKMGIDPQKLKLGMIENLEYEPSKFDFINFGAVLEHLYHPSENLTKALTWLKPGGLIHLEVPSAKYLMARVINLYYRLRGTNYTAHLSPMHSPFHLYEFQIDSFFELGKKLGFEVVSYEYEVCDILNFPRITHPIFKKIMKVTKTGMQLKVWLRKV